MINKVTRKECPELFRDITEFEIERDEDHRRGSSFYVTAIVEFKEYDRKYFPEIVNFEDYIGTWATDCALWEADWGFVDEGYTELVRYTKPLTIAERIIDFANQLKDGDNFEQKALEYIKEYKL